MTNTLRMPKGWTLVGTNSFEFGNTETKQQRIRRERKAFNIIRNTEKMTEEKLQKEGDSLYSKKITNNTQLIEAYNNKKLKSPSLIKKAKKLIKKMEKKNAAVVTQEA